MFHDLYRRSLVILAESSFSYNSNLLGPALLHNLKRACGCTHVGSDWELWKSFKKKYHKRGVEPNNSLELDSESTSIRIFGASDDGHFQGAGTVTGLGFRPQFSSPHEAVTIGRSFVVLPRGSCHIWQLNNRITQLAFMVRMSWGWGQGALGARDML